MDGPLGAPWWVLVFFVIGVAATVAVFAALFMTVNRPGRLSITSKPEVRSGEFLRGVSGAMNAPLVEGGTARLLNNGVEIFPAVLRAISEARHSVNFMVYIWEPGKASDRVFDALVERQRAGVQVRLMLDGFGGQKAPKERLDELKAAGGKVEWFNPLRRWRMLSFYKRNHRRAIVVDGRVAFTGGAAVGDRWLGDAESEEHWRDMMVEVRGCLAGNLQSAFTQLWADVCGEVLMGDAFYPPHDEEEDDRLPGEEVSRHVNVISSPAEAAHPMRVLYWVSFACARERLYLTNSYFIPDEDTQRALCERARAGVDVRVLVPGRHTDMPVVRRASQAHYQALLEAGVRIWEYQPSMLHAKTIVADGVWSVVGSANLDIRSKELNQEAVIGILDGGFGGEIEETFLEDLKDGREIRLEEWKRRGPLARTREWFCGLFAEQL